MIENDAWHCSKRRGFGNRSHCLTQRPATSTTYSERPQRLNHGRQKGEILETSLRSHSWKAVEERCPKHRFAIGTIMGSWVPAKNLLGMPLIFGDGASAIKK